MGDIIRGWSDVQNHGEGTFIVPAIKEAMVRVHL